MLTSTFCPKCNHQLILPPPEPSPFYPNHLASPPPNNSTHLLQDCSKSMIPPLQDCNKPMIHTTLQDCSKSMCPPLQDCSKATFQPFRDCSNVVVNVEVSLKLELPQRCLPDNVTVVSKALQCGGGIVTSADNLENIDTPPTPSATHLERHPSDGRHVRSIESTYPIGADENRSFGLATRSSSTNNTNVIRLNQCGLSVTAMPLNIPMSREICQRDLDTLGATVKALRLSGFYYESLSQQKALELLTNKSPGTFLVRNSSNPQHIFALSVQTMKGPTSVRLNYLNGLFYFDCDDHLHDKIAKFPCVLQLIEHYIRNASRSLSSGRNEKQQVWLDYFTRKYYSKILLVKPARKEIPKLQHLCRSSIFRNNVQVSSHSIPFSLVCYLKEYPYFV
uniref:Cytokine-inducible SH2-containing protein n=1 Tax=Cacopsylla melanoneura TaxID=428564 RepID=A0A8D8ZTZ1_9HEMI